MSNLNIPNWVKASPQTFKCYLSAVAFNDVNHFLKHCRLPWVLSTKETPMLGKPPAEEIKRLILESAVLTAVDNSWSVLPYSKSELANLVGLPILDSRCLDYEGVGHIIAMHIIDAIKQGAIKVIVTYKFKIGSLVAMPTVSLMPCGYPTRLEQYPNRTAKVTRVYHNLQDTESRIAFREYISKHQDFYYGPWNPADTSVRFLIPHEAITYTEK